MAASNPGWGYTRLRGAVWNLGHDLARNTTECTWPVQSSSPDHRHWVSLWLRMRLAIPVNVPLGQVANKMGNRRATT